MRLSDENTREGRHLTPEERIALQAEEIKQLQQENGQLRAQVARSEGCGYLNNAKCVKTTGMGVEYPKDDTF